MAVAAFPSTSQHTDETRIRFSFQGERYEPIPRPFRASPTTAGSPALTTAILVTLRADQTNVDNLLGHVHDHHTSVALTGHRRAAGTS
ncbi:hypothetical protein GCM10022402_28220 [Salinactinospora qingdaonensis]|uniref:Uncharacterized protein n=1 Tax=Salinactinospora qingdaonensis TaxID=702744 RepID=A0ABP7FU13_9ACTN